MNEARERYVELAIKSGAGQRGSVVKEAKEIEEYCEGTPMKHTDKAIDPVSISLRDIRRRCGLPSGAPLIVSTDGGRRLTALHGD